MTSRILIKNATLVTMNDDRDILERGDILVEDGTIKAVAPVIDPGSEPVKTISAGGKVVIPGLVNLHNHAAMSLFRSYADDYPLMEWLETKIFPAEARLTPEDVYWGTALALLEMIRGGTTTFVDMYYFMDETARACLEGGIRAFLCQVFIENHDNRGQAGLRDAIRFIENWDTRANSRITPILGPHAPYTCPPEFLKRVLKETEHINTPIHIHLSESRFEVEASLEKHGKTPVALMNDIGMFDRPVLAAHCVHLTDEDIEILASKQVGISHNPGSNLKLGNGIAPLKKLIERGAKVGLGTDGPASNNNLDMFEEIRLAGLVQKGFHENPTYITAEEALALATRGGAEALRLDDLGIIREGARADLAVIDFNRPHLQPRNNVVANIVYSASAGDVDTVMVDGKILYEQGNFLTLDEERIYYEANRCAAKLRL